MSQLPTLVIRLVAGEVNGKVIYYNRDQAIAMLGEFFSDEANFFAGRLKVRDAKTKEIIPRVIAFNVDEKWLVRRSSIIARATVREDREIEAAIELTPPKGM